MRLIDADELMEHVYRDRLDSREKIAQMVKNAPTIEPEQRWTPCSERLPEEDGEYLVTFDNGETDIASISQWNKFWSACDADGFYWVASKGLEVIAWMPLPSPYREEGD